MLIKIAATEHSDFRAAELQQKIKVMSGKVLDFIDKQFIIVTGKPDTDIRQQPPGLSVNVRASGDTAVRRDPDNAGHSCAVFWVGAGRSSGHAMPAAPAGKAGSKNRAETQTRSSP